MWEAGGNQTLAPDCGGEEDAYFSGKWYRKETIPPERKRGKIQGSYPAKKTTGMK